MKFIGAHVSIAGGVENAPLNAKSIGATAFAMFTKNQRQWKASPLAEAGKSAFAANLADAGIAPEHVLPHDGYLINLAQPDAEKRRSAADAFADEMRRCHELGLKLLNFHPGSTKGEVDDATGMEFVAAGVRSALEAFPTVVAVFENTAGQGSCLGASFAQLKTMLDLVGMPERVGVCLDTCHAFAAGYALDDARGRSDFLAEFGETIGFEYLRGMHLNDAQGVRGGHLDRHAPLGEGALGWECFAQLAADPRLDGIPLILETPDDARWAAEIAELKRLAGIQLSRPQ
ncbi:MAG: deoxyribonuclease IV [Lentisphaeria bacterium]|nr:deoxyribonuclease IV [Lentisphaeria bacterium]